jgi:hypothetical protein
MSVVELLPRPDARADPVEDLVAKVLRGEVRIPIFQRGLRWKAAQVTELFDSIYRGYPIGSFLFRVGYARGDVIKVGPLEIFAPELDRALWVVDGQQRLTSLAAGLGRPGVLPRTPDDPFVVYLDPRTQSFHSPAKDVDVPDVWVPLPKLFNASDLGEWIFTWPHGRDAGMRAVIFEAGRRLREYRVPVYIFETNDEATLRNIFHRVNKGGTQLDAVELHDALYGRKSDAPASLAELADNLETLGLGRPDEESQILPSLLALRGLDVTRPFKDHVRLSAKSLEGAAADAAPVLRRVLSFLRTHAEIPHLRLLPYSAPVVVLTRFFARHPAPNARTETLLVRWVWRMFLSPVLEEKTLRRQGVAAVTDDEEASAQALLALVGTTPPIAASLAERFDARSARSRLSMLGLVSLQPRRLEGGGSLDSAAVDPGELIRAADKDAFRPIFPLAGESTSSPANRILLPGRGSARNELVAFIEEHGKEHAVLRSHAIEPPAAAALLDRDLVEFVRLREATLLAAIERMSARLAEWDRNDRPSIEYLLAQAGD